MSFGYYSQPKVLARMLQVHFSQLCSLDYCTNIQYNPQGEMLRILVLIGVVYFMTRGIRFSELSIFLDSSSWQVFYKPPFFPTTPTTNFVLLFIYFLFCFLYFAFDIYIMCFLRSNKTSLSERFFPFKQPRIPFPFYSILKFLYFYSIRISILILIIISMIIFIITVAIIVAIAIPNIIS